MKKLLSAAWLFVAIAVAITSFIAPTVFGQEQKKAKAGPTPAGPVTTEAGIIFSAVRPSPRGPVRTESEQCPRARELGIAPGVFAPGPLNAITDVSGVRVGQVTLIKGDNIRTGATAIMPHPGNLFQEKVPAAIVVGNGFGKLIGSTQVNELGLLETPIILTNTLNVWEAAATLAEYTLRQPGNERVVSVNPVVGETNDGWLKDIRARATNAGPSVLNVYFGPFSWCGPAVG